MKAVKLRQIAPLIIILDSNCLLLTILLTLQT